MIESALEEARRYDDPQWSGILALGAIATVGGVLIWELMLVSLGLLIISVSTAVMIRQEHRWRAR